MSKPAIKPALKANRPMPKPQLKKARLGNGSAVTKVAPRRSSVPFKKSKPKAKAAMSAEAESASAPRPCKTFMIMAGSYEKLLYGLEGTFPPPAESGEPSTSAGGPPVPTLKPIFIFPAHVGSIRAIAASPDGKWLATGSTDEMVKVWNLKRRKEVGGLVQHEGSITYLGFPTRSTLVSASEDGNLALFRVRGWELLRSLKGHTGRVNCVAVHPSGKLALSVGKDRTLRMWDLMRGKGAASVKLGKEGEVVRWSVDGKMFAVQEGKEIDLYSTDMQPLSTIAHPSRIHDIRFCQRVDGSSEVLLVSAEDKKVSIYELGGAEGSTKVIAELVGHTNRVKSVDTLLVSLPTSDKSQPSSTTYAVTVSSNGVINLYDLSSIPPASADSSTSPKQIDPITSYDTKGSRLTCVAFAQGELDEEEGAAVNGKRKRDEEETDIEEVSEGDEEEEEQEFGGFGKDDAEEAEESD